MQVALMFLTRGDMPHEASWAGWLRSAEGMVPIDPAQDALCAHKPAPGKCPWANGVRQVWGWNTLSSPVSSAAAMVQSRDAHGGCICSVIAICMCMMSDMSGMQACSRGFQVWIRRHRTAACMDKGFPV